MRTKQIIICLHIIFFLYVGLSAQNSYIDDGSNGSWISAEIGAGAADYSFVSGNTAFSIGGVLDIGLRYADLDTTHNNNEAEDTEIGLIYNILPLSYTIKWFRIMAVVRGTYEYIIVDSDYVDSINGTMEGQGFTIGAEGLLDITPVDFVHVRCGYYGGYISRLFHTLGVDSGTPVDTRERERYYESGFLTGIWFEYKEFPIIGYEVLFLDSTQHGDYIKHRLSIVLKSY